MRISPFVKVFLQPLSGSSFLHWVRILRLYGGFDLKYLPKVIFITIMILFLFPFRLLEQLVYQKKIKQRKIEKPPVFIIGHWRSGTTYLHKILGKDPNLGYTSTFQAVMPNCFLVGKKVLYSIFDLMLPGKRLQDNLKPSGSFPQEDEIAMSNLTPYSFYHTWFFPKRMKELLKYTVIDNVSDSVRNEWKKTYTYLLKKLTLTLNGKQVVLKNPVNTGRIKYILELFPDAKFIHIYRNPHLVFKSTKKLYRRILDVSVLQDFDESDIEKNIIECYKLLMGKFLEDKNFIPQGNLVEVRFEEFEKNTLKETERIYKTLGLSFEPAKKYLKRYIQAQKNYKKNTYRFDDETTKKVERHWKFAVKQWNYLKPIK